ncbi:MAG: hypothetical protein ACI8RD_002541 [Bacillariaceae sp.]
MNRRKKKKKSFHPIHYSLFFFLSNFGNSHAFAITFTRTSPTFGGNTVISSSTMGTFGALATIALHLIGNPTVDMFVVGKFG